jgi:hypothetical protein
MPPSAQGAAWHTLEMAELRAAATLNGASMQGEYTSRLERCGQALPVVSVSVGRTVRIRRAPFRDSRRNRSPILLLRWRSHARYAQLYPRVENETAFGKLQPTGQWPLPSRRSAAARALFMATCDRGR